MKSVLGLAAGAAAAAVSKAPLNTNGFQSPVVSSSAGGHATCVSGKVPVSATSKMNVKLNYDLPKNQSEVSNTFLRFITDGSPFMKEIMGGMNTVSGNYSIHATLCVPNAPTYSETVQFLTHGIGFTGTYWDFAPGYSYVDYAAEQGYPTFYYDRLGTGMSEKAEPIQVVQTPLEIEIANNLISMLRTAKFGTCAPKKVVAVGHSFGSAISAGIAAMHPQSADAVVLTGFSGNMTGMAPFVTALNLAIASENAPYRFADLNNGYLVSSTAISNQLGFFRAPQFDPSILNLAEATKGPVTFGELFSMSAASMPAMSFTGPVDVVNGDNDLPFCFGNCSYPMNKAAMVQPSMFPKANVAKSSNFLVPGTGHGINLHYTSSLAYQHIQQFVKNAGL